jgi:hypothetical protein
MKRKAASWRYDLVSRGSGCGSSSARLLMRSKSNKAIYAVSKDEPPYETKGKVTPVRGRSRIFPAMISTA